MSASLVVPFTLLALRSRTLEPHVPDVVEPCHQATALRVQALMRLLNGPAPLGDVNSIVAARVHFVGNTMIDTQERRVPQARGGEVLEHMRLGV